MRVWPGSPLPLGASFDGVGTNIALFSDVAEAVELCLFDDDGNEERVLAARAFGIGVARLLSRPAGQHAVRLPRARPVGPRQRPPVQPRQAAARPLRPRHRGHVRVGSVAVQLRLRRPRPARHVRQRAAFAASVVVNPFFDWATDQPLGCRGPRRSSTRRTSRARRCCTPTSTKSCAAPTPASPHPAFVDHLKRLGVTTLELLPVHEFVHDAHLVERGLRNYWGYNSIGYFAPHHEYSHRHGQGQQVQDFKQMVKTLHQAGIEVILDVVYNHTAEGNHMGPTLSFKGIDNAAYYRLVADDKQYYMDYTGTGNTLNMQNPFVLQLVMDSLRYWATEMHVDGFRFDLASTLARSLHEVDRLSAFFDLVQQDPIVSRMKLIAEPWDVGEGGYQVGNFPPQWAEWNGRYRDCIRDHWAGTPQASASSPTASPARATCTRRPAASRTPASTSSPPTTDSRCAIS